MISLVRIYEFISCMHGVITPNSHKEVTMKCMYGSLKGQLFIRSWLLEGLKSCTKLCGVLLIRGSMEALN